MSSRGMLGVLSLALSVTFFSACATTSLKRTQIKLMDVSEKLSVKSAKPNSDEAKGVLLRLKAPAKPLRYRDTLQMFAQIQDDTAIPLNVDKTRTVAFKNVRVDKKRALQVTVLTKAKDGTDVGKEIFTESDRGEILSFHSGVFTRDAGTLKVLSHTRTAVFPEGKVKIGDKWSYDETMENELAGSWMSQRSESPTKIKVVCELTGFADVLGHRCAVITSKTVSHGKGIYNVFWKDTKVKIDAYATETAYFDYKQGVEVATVTRCDSSMSSTPDLPGTLMSKIKRS